MRTSLSDNLLDIEDARKTAVIDRELHRLNIDIAALQETRLPENGSIKEEHYTFFWQGKGVEDIREHGVGFAVRNNLLRMIEPLSNGTERILTFRLSTPAGFTNLVCIYAPTLQASSVI
jgi:exonuclease III